MYTDGLTETRNAAGEMLGEKTLRTLLAGAGTHRGEVEGAKQFMLQQINRHAGEAALTDDQTLILIKHLK